MMDRLVDIKEKDVDRWSSFTAQIQGLLNAAITADGASKGNVQLFNPYLDGLQIVATRRVRDQMFMTLQDPPTWGLPSFTAPLIIAPMRVSTPLKPTIL